MTMNDICAFIHNFFTNDEDKRAGTYAIENGSISLPFLLDGQYFRIVGSALNDGVYKYPPVAADGLMTETFTGEIWAMRVPRAVAEIAGEIDAWNAKYGEAVNSPYQSESFNGYSYTKASAAGAGKSAQNGTPTWQSTFGARLNQWRRLA